MGKHETGYAHVADSFYPTKQPFVIDALAHHLDLRGAHVWEPSAGAGDMARALLGHGCAYVYRTDLIDRGDPDEVLDFLANTEPMVTNFSHVISNPPGGPRNTTAVAFVERGLRYVERYGVTLAFLLPADFDRAVTRRHLFADCAYFAATIVLTKRITWFEREDGERAAPKEWHRWFIWSRPQLNGRQPIHLYDPPRERS